MFKSRKFISWKKNSAECLKYVLYSSSWRQSRLKRVDNNEISGLSKLAKYIVTANRLYREKYLWYLSKMALTYWIDYDLIPI